MNLWVFDLDGTLVTSNIDYHYALLDFCRLMLSTLGHKAPHFLKVLDLEGEIDKERFKTMRADRNRFPGSLAEAYRELCRRAGVEFDPAIERQVLEIGNSALSEKTYQNRTMIPGVEELLAFLQDRGDLLYCVTFGDRWVQWMKWRGTTCGAFSQPKGSFARSGTKS